MADKERVIVTAALTGGATPKSINEHLPMSPEEIAEDAYQCWKAGAAIVHLHMRNEDGTGSEDPERFRKTISLIRAHEDCDVIINCTSLFNLNPLTNEMRCRPFKEVDGIEIGSYDAGSINYGGNQLFSNDPQLLDDLATTYKSRGIKPEIEVFDTGMIYNAEHIAKKKGLIDEPLYFQIVMGVLGGVPANVENLQHMVDNLPEGSLWSAFGIGLGHLPIMYAALAMGADGVRVGLEDCVKYDRNTLATNPMLVERAVRVVKEFNKRPATPSEAREILHIPQLKK